MTEREEALLKAQKDASPIFEGIVEHGLIRAGILESELAREITDYAHRTFGITRHWHPLIVRSGPNTLLTYRDSPPDRLIMPDDVLFLDTGFVVCGWEADLGRSYCLGTDARKHTLCNDARGIFEEGKKYAKAWPNVAAGALYDYVSQLANGRGWELMSGAAGHLVDKFPHERDPLNPNRLRVCSGNSLPLDNCDSHGQRRHWILEVHLGDRRAGYGAFYEELVTL